MPPTQSSHEGERERERVIVMGKSLHDPKELSLCQIFTNLQKLFKVCRAGLRLYRKMSRKKD